MNEVASSPLYSATGLASRRSGTGVGWHLCANVLVLYMYVHGALVGNCLGNVEGENNRECRPMSGAPTSSMLCLVHHAAIYRWYVCICPLAYLAPNNTRHTENRFLSRRNSGHHGLPVGTCSLTRIIRNTTSTAPYHIRFRSWGQCGVRSNLIVQHCVRGRVKKKEKGRKKGGGGGGKRKGKRKKGKTYGVLRTYTHKSTSALDASTSLARGLGQGDGDETLAPLVWPLKPFASE
ncbi:hypothetical protein V8C37DRAFT_337098 [Trichoderma ceciliae]